MNAEYYITTPIYYANNLPHIGTAYTSIIADSIARYKMLQYLDVFLASGTDEHGQKIFNSASERGIDTQEFLDSMSYEFRNLLTELGIDISYFIRTSSSMHKDYIRKMWLVLKENGYIYKGKYIGWYSERDEAFFSKDDLVDGKAPTGATVELIEEECYFFRLSSFSDSLLAFYDNNPDFVMPNERYNEIRSFVKAGLKDLCISRKTKWGIPVPGDDEQTVYVWIDALFNYTSLLYINDAMNYWPANLHVIGKDILRFHGVYWPALLMACDMPLPKQLLVHGWWMVNGEKMSKSLGNVVDPLKKIEQFGIDRLRYYLLRDTSLSNDGDYSDSNLIARTNADLSNNIGNLVQRVLSLVYKYNDGDIPELDNPNSVDSRFLDRQLNEWEKSFCALMDDYRISQALEEICKFADECNAYINDVAPWNLFKVDRARSLNVLYVLINGIRNIGILLQPFIPQLAKQILDLLGETIYDVGSMAFSVLQSPVIPNRSMRWDRKPLIERIEIA